ncbi:cyclodeaminase/cyclohydrolase family protein [Haloarcula onubensis]|uniref:Cyclodeaminase/cyclohydrolase family protein n=1 Tax=Haloarcula onubensis TaxID=2950539 RepID=A0ABU2FKI6_9EURY|nr:cyclodeaminase/cyclohydrolase family protein [Halomicroarcula sp. S3CR25-11]MDS0280716.1 cyclodeaminase/cyclohydrolase family protein [Halomicroarcula sp. S3CR25-11]
MTYAERSVDGFLSGVASAQVAPSAGAVTAVTGAMAASLCEMVCLHTSESERTERLADAQAAIRDRRDLLLALADEDGAAVDEVQTAFEERRYDGHEQAALRTATEIPLRIAEAAQVVAHRAVVVAEDGTANAQADAVVGAMLARAAVTSAASIVRANLDLLDDESFERNVRARTEAAETTADEAVAAVRQ